MPRARMPPRSRSTRCWPARKSCIPSVSSRAPGARHCRAYWIVTIAMSDAPILITGGAGFIGSHLGGAPLSQGHAVRVLDKLASEHYLDFYRRQHGLEPAIFRFFNIFGPRQDPSSPYSGVISIFTQRAQQGLPIRVFGDGEQTRDFFYIDDLLALLTQALDMPQVVVGAVNVGWNQAVSLNQLLAEIGSLCGGLPAVEYQAARPGDIRHSRANNQHLQASYRLPT